MDALPPALVLNADFRPLSYHPLSTWSWQETIHSVYRDRVSIVEYYEGLVIRSPKTEHRVPSIVALKQYAPGKRAAPFTRFNVFMRDGFACQYCGQRFTPDHLTFDHVRPRAKGGVSSWTNVVTACAPCNHLKGSGSKMKPFREPRRPSPHELYELGRKFPPRYLHRSWLDYAYFDVPLDET